MCRQKNQMQLPLHSINGRVQFIYKALLAARKNLKVKLLKNWQETLDVMLNIIVDDTTLLFQPYNI